MARRDDGREEGPTRDEIMEMLRSMMCGQRALKEQLARDDARGEGDSNSGRGCKDGADTGGRLPTLGVVDEAREELVESASTGVNVGPRGFSSIKRAVPKYSGKPEDFFV